MSHGPSSTAIETQGHIWSRSRSRVRCSFFLTASGASRLRASPQCNAMYIENFGVKAATYTVLCRTGSSVRVPLGLSTGILTDCRDSTFLGHLLRDDSPQR